MAWSESKAWLRGKTSGRIYQDLLDDAAGFSLDVVHHLHGFDDAEDVAFLHGLADVDERLGFRREAR